MSVSSRVRSGTNMIEITVEGTNPQLVQQFANQIGQSTLEYVNVLYEVYDMNILDDAVLPVAPIRPDTKMNLALSVVLGFVFGVGLALLLGSMSFSAVPTSSQEKEVSAGQETLENI